MVFDKLKNRFIAIISFVLVLFGVLSVYFYCFIAGAQAPVEQAENGELLTEVITEDEDNIGKIAVKGERGSIMDINGTVLAYNELSYNLEFTYDTTLTASSDTANYTQVFLKTIDIIEQGGASLEPEFFIIKDEEDNFVYNTAGLSEENAQLRVEKWLENMAIAVGEDETVTPEEAYYQLRDKYRIPEDMPFSEAYKVLSIWQEIRMGLYQSFVPITIAENISYDTVLKIETLADELIGMKVTEGSSRVYPYGQTACHILGYEGKITSEDNVDRLKDNGYNVDNDNVGKTGVEATMESYLTACSSEKKGIIEVELDDNNNVLGELSYTAPKGGDDVYLTIDLKMQQVLEEALEKNIKAVYEKQMGIYLENKEKYDDLASSRTDGKINFCESGAAIVMEVSTARVLAMASYPGYDLNLFVGGIEDSEFQALLEASGSPLFNNAVSSASVPGSIYKLVTGIAALEEGATTLYEQIDDQGPYDKYVQYGHAPACSISNFSKHSDQTIVEAIKNSCNYYFYELADRMGIDKINNWAERFGVTDKTGIELTGEVSGRVGSQLTLYDNTKGVNEQISFLPKLVYNQIKNYLKECGEKREIEYTDEQLSRAAESIIKLAGSNETEGYSQYGPEIREILSRELDIATNISDSKQWSSDINIMLTQLIWNPTLTVTQGIGTSPTQITPIGSVSYVAAIGNGGKLLKPHIIDSVVDNKGEVVYKSEVDVVADLEIDEVYLDKVIEGMHQVVAYTDGTAYESFADFEYKDRIAGKTGTGQVSEIDLENNGWFVCLAPYNEGEPQIAIVVFLNHGYSGSSSTATARDFLQYYFDSMETEEEEASSPNEGEII